MRCLASLCALCFFYLCASTAIARDLPSHDAGSLSRACCITLDPSEIVLAQRTPYRAPAPTYRPPAYRAPQSQPRSAPQFQQQRQQMQQQMRQRIDQQRAQIQRQQAERRQQIAAQRARMAQERAEQARRTQERLKQVQAQRQQQNAEQQKKLDELRKRNVVIGTRGASLAVLATTAIPPHLQVRVAKLTERTFPANDNRAKRARAGGGSRGGGDGSDGLGPGNRSIRAEFGRVSAKDGEAAKSIKLDKAVSARLAQLIVVKKNESSAPGLYSLFANGRKAKAGEVRDWAISQGWKLQKTENGPMTFVDANGVKRITIKQGSPRTPGSGTPHVEIRNSDNFRIAPSGARVSRRSIDNHTPIEWDIE